MTNKHDAKIVIQVEEGSTSIKMQGCTMPLVIGLCQAVEGLLKGLEGPDKEAFRCMLIDKIEELD